MVREAWHAAIHGVAHVSLAQPPIRMMQMVHMISWLSFLHNRSCTWLSPSGNSTSRDTWTGDERLLQRRPNCPQNARVFPVASQAPVTSPTLPQPAPARARTLEAGKRWAINTHIHKSAKQSRAVQEQRQLSLAA